MSAVLRFAIQSPSPVGAWTIVSDGQAIVGVYSERHRNPPSLPRRITADSLCDEASRQISEYFAGRRTSFDVLLAPAGSEFDHRVWDALREIPFGITCCYSELAQRIGSPNAARAVGAANGRNPISLLIPCHRVIGAGGAHVGYAGGLSVKAWLLDHEMTHCAQFAAR